MGDKAARSSISLRLLGLINGLLLIGALFILWSDYRSVYDNTLRLLYTKAQMMDRYYSLLLQQRAVELATIGSRVLELGGLEKRSEARNYLESIVRKTPAYVGLGLADAQGQLVMVTGLDPHVSLPNLFKSKESRDTALATLVADGLIVGDVYFFKPKGRWVLPLRIAIRDQLGQVVALMTAGMDVPELLQHLETFGFEAPYRLEIVKRETGRVLLTLPLEEAKFTSVLGQPDQIYRIQRRWTVRDFSDGFRAFEGQDLLADRPVIGVECSTDAGILRVSVDKAVIRTAFLDEAIPVLLAIAGLLLVINGAYLWGRYRQQQHERELAYSQTHSLLTGLLNARGLQQDLEMYGEKGQGYALLDVDIDDFKRFNETYDRQLGDYVIREVADRLEAALKDDEALYHLGADEFILLCPETDTATLSQRARQLQQVVSRPILSPRDGGLLRIRVTIGIAVIEAPDKASPERAIANAHAALHQARQRGAAEISFFLLEENEALRRLQRVEQALGEALSHGQIQVYYQPQVDAASGRIVGAEALVRWIHPDLGFIPPDEFISVAEREGLIEQLDQYVLRKGVQAFNDYAQLKSLHLAVNISSVSFLSNDLCSLVDEIVRASDFDPARLHLEITETALLSDMERARKTADRLAQRGYLISLDDFGTGYSSLSLLTQLPARQLKIDRSFVQHMCSVSRDARLVHSTIEMAHALEMQVVAEGVETEEIAARLAQMNCDLLQGYLYSPAVPLDEFIALVDTYNG